MQYQLVVFDIAGTTVHDGDAVATCLRQALHAVAASAFTRDEVNEFMGISKRVAITHLLEKRLGRRPHDALVAGVLQNFEGRMLDYYRTSPDVAEVDGAAAVFAGLREQGAKIALDTGFGRQIADVLLKRLGWLDSGMIDATVTIDEVAAGRPAPDMVYRAMEMTGVPDISRVVKVGDTPSDLHEGTNAGCGLVVGVTAGSHTAAQLRIHPHSALIESVRDLPALLGWPLNKRMDVTMATRDPASA